MVKESAQSSLSNDVIVMFQRHEVVDRRRRPVRVAQENWSHLSSGLLRPPQRHHLLRLLQGEQPRVSNVALQQLVETRIAER